MKLNEKSCFALLKFQKKFKLRKVKVKEEEAARAGTSW